MLVAALALAGGLVGTANAAELTFNRAYQGGLSGQTFTTTTALNADAGSIRFADGGTQRSFQNTSGTLYYTIGGVPYSETGVLNSRYPNGSTLMNAVAFSGTGGDRLLVLGGAYTTSSAYSGSSNAIVTKLNEYVDATAPDPAQTTLLVNGGTSVSVAVGQSVTIVVTVKLGSGTAISGATVSLSASPSNLSSTSPSTATTNSSGQATFTVTGTSSGTATYNAVAMANGTNTTSSSSVSVTYTGVRSAAQTTAVVPAGTVGVATTVTITVRDGSGTVVTGAASGLSATIGGTNVGATPSAVTELGSGVYKFTYTPTAPGTDSVAIKLDSTAIGGSPYSSLVTAPTLAFTPTPGALPGGTVGSAYSQTISVSGGTAPYAFTATGLPTGLTINAATGAITGTPTVAGSYSVTVGATDTYGTTGSASYTIAVAVQAPVANAVSATVAANSSSNAVTLNVTGGTATSVAVASQASHGTATANGTSISYTPTAGYAGSDSFTYTATNATGTSAPATVTITVSAPTLVFTPAPGALPGGTVGSAYSQTISISGGTAPYAFTATGLPTGLTINAATGAITGTPTADGSFTVTVGVTDTYGTTGSASYTIAVAVQAPVANAVSTSVAANSSNNAVTLNVTGGTATSVAVASAASHGTATANGTSIAYTPTAGYAGSDSFTYTATNATGTSAPATVTVTVGAPTLVFAPAPGALPGGTAGTPYSQTISVSGGTAPYSFTATGLPTGMTINASTGAISGTPTVAGSYSVTIDTTDAHGTTGSASYTIAVAVQAPVANAVSASVAANSSNNAVTLSLTGGTAASVAVASQASHGTATANGTSISYTPTAGYAGSDSFTYTATNATGTSAPATVSITVGAPTLVFTPTPGGLPGGMVGTAYSQTVSVSGGTAPYAFTATGLPAGLTIDPSTGAVTGTPTTAGSYTVTVNVTDAHGTTGSASYTIVIAVQPPVANAVSVSVAANSTNNAATLSISGGAASSVAVASQASHGSATANGTSISYTPTAGYAGSDSFTYTATNASGTSTPATVTVTVGAPALLFGPAPGSLPGGTVGTPYSQIVSVSAGTAPYVFTAIGLPAGLAIDPSTGAVTGTPTTAGNYTVTVNVIDAHGTTGTASYTVVIAVQPPVANAVSATVAANSSNNSVTLSLTGGAASTVAIGSAPTHGTASASGTSISYTPTAGYAGADSFTYTASNASGTSSPATVSITVSAPTLAFTPTPGALPGGMVGMAYSQTVSVTGGTAPYAFTATGLPTGLAINPSTGIVTGTPTTAGSYSVTVNVTDVHGSTGSATYTIVIAVQAPVANAVSTSVAANSSNNAVTLNVTGGATASVAVASAASHGTATANGTSITYTPTAGYSGNDSFTYTATNASGTSTPATVSVTVGAPALVFGPAPGSLPGGTVGTAYSQTVSVSGGTAPYAFTASGLPVGLTIDPATGAVTGTPTTAGSFTVTITVTDAHGATGSASYTIVIAVQAPTAGTVSTTVAANSADNSVTLSLGGGIATSVAVASQPAHGTVSVSGLSIRYTPAAGYAGADSFTYTATNASGTSAAATVSITVSAPPVVFAMAPGPLPGGTAGAAYSQAIPVSGGTAPYSFSATGLPAGLTLDPSTGAVTGTPTTEGSYSVTITVTDAHGATASVSYTIVVVAPPAPVAADATTASVPANTTTKAGQNVGINLSTLVTGEYDEIRIVTQPRHGTVVISRTLAMRGGSPLFMMAALGASALEVPSQVIAVYTPEPDYHGADSFQYAAFGPGGSSAPATVAIQVVGQAPAAQAQTVGTTDGKKVSVELTTGATEGPFTDAAILSVTPASQASATIVAGGTAGQRTFRLDVTPKARFSGAIVISYTLTNAFGTSAPATVTVNVTRRPDPAKDPVVQAVSDAQAEAARRFSRAQTSNFMRRAEGLHGDCAMSMNGLRVTSSDGVYTPLPNEKAERAQDTGRTDESGKAVDDAQPVTDACGDKVAVWTGGTIDVGTRDAVTQRAKISATTSGISAGVDTHVAADIALGIGGGLGHDSSRIATDKGRVTADTAVVAVYGSITPARGLFVDGVLAHGWLDFGTRRIDATTGAATVGSRSGSFTAGSLAAGVDRVSGPLQWSLYGRADYLSGRLAAYREQGAGMYDLRFDARDIRSTSSTLGFRAAYRQPLSFGLFSATLRGEWQHEFTGGTGQGLDYADIDGASVYSLPALGWSREQFLLAPGIKLSLPSDWDFALDVGLRAAAGERAASTSLRVRKAF